MNEEDLIQWLSRGRFLRQRVQALEESASAAWEAMECACSGSEEAAASQAATLYPQAVEAAEGERKRLDAVLAEITQAVSRMDDNLLAALLQERYVNCRTWEQVANSLGYSLPHVHRLHRAALARITGADPHGESTGWSE